jgi:Lhr-like helicase
MLKAPNAGSIPVASLLRRIDAISPAHHGSLSKTLRELEERLQAGSLPTIAICTSTLELCVDIGPVKSVAQIGAPRSLSSL